MGTHVVYGEGECSFTTNSYLYLRLQVGESSQSEVRLGVGSKPLLFLSYQGGLEEVLVKTPYGNCIIAAKTVDDLRCQRG